MKKIYQNEFNTLINSYEKKIKDIENRIFLINLEHNRQYNLLMNRLIYEKQNPMIYLPSVK